MLSDRISFAISKGFKIPPPPTISAHIADKSQMAFSHFQSALPQPGYSTPSAREEAFVFNLPLAPARYASVSIDGKAQSVVQSPGEAYLFDLTSRNVVSLDTTYNSVRFHLPQSAIDTLAYESGLPRIGGLHAKQLGQKDEILYRLALALYPAIVNSSQVTTTFVEYMALAIHDHVIYTYSSLARGHRAKGGLSPWQIRRACDYIEEHLTDEPSVSMLSAECGLSRSHFIRSFRSSLGMSPHQWIIQRRLERAMELMADARLSLAEIAVSCGFVDQSHLGRHFLKAKGVGPAQWRRHRS